MRWSTKLEILALLVGAACAMDAVALADPPGLVNYQGVLRDAADAPVTAAVDMIFHLYDAAAAGNEILVDRHLAGLMGDVAVSGGLFNVALGGGSVVDGSGGGAYATLAEVFRDFGEVYLEVEIETPMGFETLAPRTRIVSAAYALSATHAASSSSAESAANAAMLGGVGPGQFLRSDASDAFTAGTLTLDAGTTLDVKGSLFANGSIRMDADGPDGNQFLYFFNGSPTTEALSWDDADSRFVFSDEVAIAGTIRVGTTTTAPVAYNHFGAGGTPSSALIQNSSDVYVASDLELDGTLFLDGILRMDENGPDGLQSIYFFEDGSPTGRSLQWDNTNDRFQLNDNLRVDWISTTVGGGIAGGVFLNIDGPDGDSYIYFYEDGTSSAEYLRWNNAADVFVFNDDLSITGDLSAGGVKNFVQNHPYRSDLSVVYTALEGDEPGTFTRGVGRLAGGEARVRLGETFALVTNPDIGLTAHLTPREAWAELYVEALTTSEIVVRAAPGAPQDIAFDYIVFGLRIGYEDHRALRPRTVDAPVPFEGHYEERYREHPELRSSSALQRHRRMREAAGIASAEDLTASAALRRAIGEHDPEAPTRREEFEVGQAGLDPAQLADDVVAESGVAPPSSTAPATAVAAVEIHATEAEPAIRGRAVRPSRGELSISMPVEEPVEAGDVLVTDSGDPSRLRQAARAFDSSVVGVAAAPSELSFDDAGSTAEGRVAFAPVVFGGVVRCKVDASYGEIRVGDLLTTSPTPGHAMLATEPIPGTIVGKALEPIPVGAGTIQILVMQR